MRNENQLIIPLWPPTFEPLSKSGMTDENGGSFQVTFAPQERQQWVIDMLAVGLTVPVAGAELLFGWEKFPFQQNGGSRTTLQYWQLDDNPAGLLVGGGSYEFPDSFPARRGDLRTLYVAYPDRVFISILSAGAIPYTVTGRVISAPFGVDMSGFIR